MSPKSPHLFVYKFPITAISSITARLTGLGASAAYIAGGCCALVGKEDIILDWYHKRTDLEKAGLHFGVLLPATYHTLAGFRHLVWDANPSLLTTPQVARSSVALFGASAVFSVALTALTSQPCSYSSLPKS